MGEEEAGKVGVETLVAGDKLVRERKTRHETTLLQPENRGERTREEDTFDGSEGDKALGKGRVGVLNPFDGPVGLLLDARNGLDRVEEVCALLRIFDVGIDEEGVGLGVDVLHHDLETVEAASLWGLDFIGEPLDKVLVDNSVRSSKEGKNVRDEVALIIIHAVVPVVKILGQINLFGGPERGLSLLIHLPNL